MIELKQGDTLVTKSSLIVGVTYGGIKLAPNMHGGIIEEVVAKNTHKFYCIDGLRYTDEMIDQEATALVNNLTVSQTREDIYESMVDGLEELRENPVKFAEIMMGNTVGTGEREPGGGRKADGGKLRYDLVPAFAIKGLAEVLTMGADKYEANSWMLVNNAGERYYAALMRHLMAWRSGEKVDDESGYSHLKHILFNVMCLLHFDEEVKSES